LSVVPRLHRKGIGSLLVRQGLQRLREEGFETALVLGSPKYYPRFGFSSALARKIRAPHRTRGDAFMAVELVTGALAGPEGEASFPDVLVPTEPNDGPRPVNIIVYRETDPGQKRKLQEHLTRLLPEWFGKAESNAHYAARAEVLDGYVAEVGGVARGLLLLGKNSATSAEIYWMGVDPTLHRKGIGKVLVEAAAAGTKASGVKWFFVATLHPKDTYEPYRRTRSFYEAQGFEFVLEEQFPADPENPVGWYMRPL
jgi:predicted N-acetyltransferase YhbS